MLSSKHGLSQMLLTSFRRPNGRRRLWQRLLPPLLISFLILDLACILLSGSPASTPPPLSPIPPPEGSGKDRVFIASIHWNNENILRSHWTNAVVDLVRRLGAENVYVAVFESGSWDNSKGALRILETELEELGVEKTIVLDETTHKDEIERVPEGDSPGWIWTPRGKKELRRIPYLARLRNQALDVLTRLASREENKRVFDKVLWINDVVFSTEDIITLLGTRGGNYAAACSLDFSRPPLYYDTFALRDISGAQPVTQTWPYFSSYTSRHALMSNKPVPVQSCWNGIVAFDAKPFYSQPRLTFRGVPDSLAKHHLEGSECCLIHKDNPLTPEKGVWLNPNVRVGYNGAAYGAVHPADANTWPSRWERVNGVWKNRWVRWTIWPRRLLERIVVRWRIRRWASQESDTRGQEVGVECLINEMQVLVWNGWAHV